MMPPLPLFYFLPPVLLSFPPLFLPPNQYLSSTMLSTHRAVIKWREKIIKEENPDQGKEEDKEEEMEVQEEEDEKV